MNNVSVKNLLKMYEGFTLNNISFEIPKGAIVGLIGANGSGKTTTLASILNTIDINGGNISIFDEDAKNLSIESKGKIGCVWSENSLPEYLNLKQIGCIMKSIYLEWDDEKYKKYLDMFNLPIDKKIKDMSYGMKRKSEIVCELSNNSKLLILDEVMSGLDALSKDRLIDILLEFNGEDNSILISEHMTDSLESISDYIIYIKNGEIIFYEETEKLIYSYGIIKCLKEEFYKIEKYVMGYIEENGVCEVFVSNIEEIRNKNFKLTIEKTRLERMLIILERGM